MEMCNLKLSVFSYFLRLLKTAWLHTDPTKSNHVRLYLQDLHVYPKPRKKENGMEQLPEALQR
jgi:hypothetical protein